ncbi:hypothetical protein EVAR_19755_1 [Eumeta japonica]|uniref:Uncharacterized protein n=1 Tax=Eumeta variegata TaxID=151549 RepID=A0A4C1USD1_EUMVA|nr:hypothetical protein EVAR_19755_1 [Eumeta japonica]
MTETRPLTLFRTVLAGAVSCRSHTGKQINRFLKDKNVELMSNPTYSPDLALGRTDYAVNDFPHQKEYEKYEKHVSEFDSLPTTTACHWAHLFTDGGRGAAAGGGAPFNGCPDEISPVNLNGRHAPFDPFRGAGR